MKRAIRIFVAIILTVATVAVIIPANLAEASGRTRIEQAEVIEKNDIFVQDIIDRFLWEEYNVNIKDYSAETFRPGDDVTYGELAQWIYCRINEPKKCPSQKKAIKWLKKVYYEVALAHPEYAEEISASFLDGRQGKFNYKKAATYEWLDATCYVVAWYNNDGAWVNGYDDFDFDIHRVDRYLATGGAERDNGDEYDNNYNSLYYSRIWGNYSSDTIHPARIAALEILGMLGVSIFSNTPPWNWKGR